MSDASTYSALNELLINVGRSLLQYVGECWPWSDPDSREAQHKIDELVRIQKTQVVQLANVLNHAEWTIDFGTYPTEYTDLHYVALDYLLDQLIQNQEGLIEEAKRTLPDCEGSPEAKRLVGEIDSVQHTIVQELRTLAKSPAPNRTKAV
jgi:hypothetical protein